MSSGYCVFICCWAGPRTDHFGWTFKVLVIFSFQGWWWWWCVCVFLFSICCWQVSDWVEAFAGKQTELWVLTFFLLSPLPLSISCEPISSFFYSPTPDASLPPSVLLLFSSFPPGCTILLLSFFLLSHSFLSFLFLYFVIIILFSPEASCVIQHHHINRTSLKSWSLQDGHRKVDLMKLISPTRFLDSACACFLITFTILKQLLSSRNLLTLSLIRPSGFDLNSGSLPQPYATKMLRVSIWMSAAVKDSSSGLSVQFQCITAEAKITLR